MIKSNSNDFYRRFIANLGILYIRAEHNKDQLTAEYYRNIYKKLELIQERRHLALIEEESKEKIIYEEILQIVENMYKEENDQTFKNTIQEVEALLNEKYDNNLEETEKEKQQTQEEKEK